MVRASHVRSREEAGAFQRGACPGPEPQGRPGLYRPRHVAAGISSRLPHEPPQLDDRAARRLGRPVAFKELHRGKLPACERHADKAHLRGRKAIPKGKVASYGRVAELAGNPKMSRAVGNALHRNPDPENIPCYRVVNAKGELAGAFAFGGERVQEELLLADGIEVVNGRVDLEKYGF